MSFFQNHCSFVYGLLSVKKCMRDCIVNSRGLPGVIRR